MKSGLKIAAGLILVVLLLVPLACSKAPAAVFDTGATPPIPGAVPGPTMYPLPMITVTATATARPYPTPIPMPTPTPAPAPPGVSDAGLAYDAERMIVRTGDMALVVQDIPAAIDSITRLAETARGYVVSSRTWRDGESLHGNITIRVPAGDFGNIMTAIDNLAVEVVSSTTSSKDVTEEYVDLTARLKNLEATEEQLLRIMAKAEKVDEILNVQRELSRTRSEIEQTRARMQYLERTSATSLINVSLEQSRLSVKFTASKRFVKAGEKVQFVSQIAGGFAPYSHEWDFGDGSTSTDAAPLHAYSAPGSYTVTLKATDDRGNTATQTTKDYITIQPGWSAARTLDNALNGLATFGRVLANIFIWLGIFSPVWIIIGGILYWRLRRRPTKGSR